MNKIFIYILAILVMPAVAISCPPSPPQTGSCPQGTTYADGCSAGVTGTPQNTALLNPYGAHRPPWNVAGVDYRVGYSGTLSDPSVPGNLPGCATYSSDAINRVDVNSAPCTLDHLDFSLHNGICLQSAVVNNSATITITNNNFQSGSQCQQPGGGLVNITGNVNSVIMYNTFDGAYNQNLSNILNLAADGNRTIEYNVFLRTDQHFVAFQKSGTYTLKYNYAFGVGCCGAHGDWFVFNNASGTSVTLTEGFNTVWSDSSVTGGATTYCYMATNTGVALVSGTCANDTYISTVRPDGSYPVGYMVRVDPPGIQGPATISSNYIDFAGSFGAIEGAGSGSTQPVTCSGNIDLNTGNPVPAVYGTFFPCN
jgi:hypothetical protein